MDRATLARAVGEDPEIALRLLASLASRVRGLVERLDQQTVRTVAQRLAALLLSRHRASGRAPFLIARTQAEAAEELGTVREVLVRTLRQFRNSGLIDAPKRGHYLILDQARLKRMAAD
jgi:CRP-like cAMP-binding protein